MKLIGIIPNMEKDHNLDFTKKLASFITENSCTPLLTSSVGEKLGYSDVISDVNEIYTKADFIIVLGGDGTILRVARKAAVYSVPILGINFGTLGYLADIEKNNAFEAVKKVLSGDYKIEKRMMLEAFIDKGSIYNESYISLNEVCITNGVFSRMIEINLTINEDFIDNCRADGIIISTPTGSTAYNLSAGGPILKPDNELIAVTYVCPHTLYTRPYVISGDDIVKIKIGGDYNNVILSFDGQQSVPVKNNDTIIIKRSKYYTSMIKTTDLSFYDILRRKMVEVRK